MSDKDSVFHKYRYHNPFLRAGRDYDAQRSYLFVTYDKKVPGGFAKIMTAAMILGTFYGAYQLIKWKGERERMKMTTFEYKRKSTPFLQVIEDRKLMAAQQREEWLYQELFKDKSEELLALKRIYNDPMMWESGKNQGYMHYLGIQRSYKSKPRAFSDGLLGHDAYRQNIPTEHF